jgi:hypothetical protein
MGKLWGMVTTLKMHMPLAVKWAILSQASDDLRGRCNDYKGVGAARGVS